VGWIGHVAYIGKKKNAYTRSFGGESQKQRDQYENLDIGGRIK
jgi:hypothetical protein